VPFPDKIGTVEAAAVTPAPKDDAVPWYRRLGGAPREDPRGAISVEIAAALNDVAGAVASARCMDDVLATIADRAKRITGAEKAAVVLTDETGESLDVDTVVVRGQLTRHVQDWWLQRLDELCEETIATGESIMECHDEDHAWLVCSPLRIREQPVGVLAVINSAERPFTDLQVALLAILSAFAASSIESTRIAAHGRSLLLDAERERIARELHDGLVQSLFSVSLGLEACKKQTLRDPQGVALRLGGIQKELTTAMGELRRFVYDLRPMDVRTLGLSGAISQWIRRIGDQTTAHGRLVFAGEPRSLTLAEEACLYAVAKESVSNVARHANADHYEVRIEYDATGVMLSVIDDGDGFDLGDALERGDSGCLGLLGMRERVDKIGGALSIESKPGDGTSVTVTLLQTGSD